ncbi:unnamed protein product [Protopolystoma xenopodis]|uniref:Uncharacterized protein n=1 Tax=Protopolystoma xenopodis TaxID=117903 RepID=A0A448WVJ7_9PLAT|nr:unnamed protein product [Protopolystoma xenopodis]
MEVACGEHGDNVLKLACSVRRGVLDEELALITSSRYDGIPCQQLQKSGHVTSIELASTGQTVRTSIAPDNNEISHSTEIGDFPPRIKRGGSLMPSNFVLNQNAVNLGNILAVAETGEAGINCDKIGICIGSGIASTETSTIHISDPETNCGLSESLLQSPLDLATFQRTDEKHHFMQVW